MSTTRLLGLTAALALGAMSVRAQTNGYLLTCSAAAPLGRGCATLGDPGDPAGMLANPAGLTFLNRRTLSLNGAAFLPTMSYTNAVNSLTAGKDNVYPLPAIYLADRPRGRWMFGLAAQTLGGMGADYQLDHPLLGANQRYHSKFGLMKSGIVAAYQLSSRLSVGATAGALYGQVEFATPYAVNPAQLAGLAGLAQDPDYAPLLAGFTEATAYADMSGMTGFGFTAGASVAYRSPSGFVAALAWTAPSTLTMGGGRAAMDMSAQFGQLYQGMVAAKGGDTATVNAQLAGFGIDFARGMATQFNAAVDFGVPQTLTLSVGARPAARWRAGVDLGWIGWKSAFEDMPVRLNNGSNANINILMNGSPTNGSFATAWPTDWKNAWIARAGLEFAATPALELRGGAIHGSNPVASDYIFTIFPAIVRSAATLGAGYRLGSTTVNLAYAHTFVHSQTAAATHMVAAEYAGSTSRLSENTVALGLSWRF